MADFGKLNFSVSFNPTSAFPLDARCYFTDYASAEAAAATAEEAGSTNTVYYYGMRLLVDDGETVTWYTIQRDNTLKQDAADGKSAYQYAVDGGYEGTEEEFATKLAELMNGTSTPGDDSDEDDDNTIQGGTSDDVAMGQASKAVLVTEQTLTDEEKAQARTNIGALSESDISETLLQRLIAQQFSKFIVIGQDEPEYGPCLWFDTNITVPIYLVLDDFTDGTVASAEVDNVLYDVLNTDNPSFADDGTVVLTISE